MQVIILETGVGLTNSNSFIDVAFADTYLAQQNHTDWVDTPAQGTLYLPDQPIDGDTLTINAKVYTFQDTLTDSDGNVQIGDTVEETQNNLRAAVMLAGVPSVNYAASTTEQTDVVMAAFSSGSAILTAVDGGVSGNEITLAADTTSPTNRFDAAFLGRVQAGKDDKTRCILAACLYLETNYRGRWKERRSTQLQALSWPRAYIDDSDRYPVSSAIVPVEVKYAQAEVAYRILKDEVMTPDVEIAGGAIVSESVTVGPISTSKSYQGSGKLTKKTYRIVDLLLRPYLMPSGTVWRA